MFVGCPLEIQRSVCFGFFIASLEDLKGAPAEVSPVGQGTAESGGRKRKNKYHFVHEAS